MLLRVRQRQGAQRRVGPTKVDSAPLIGELQGDLTKSKDL